MEPATPRNVKVTLQITREEYEFLRRIIGNIEHSPDPKVQSACQAVKHRIQQFLKTS